MWFHGKFVLKVGTKNEVAKQHVGEESDTSHHSYHPFFFFKLLLLFTCKSIALLESEDPHNIMRSGNMWSLTVPTSKSQNSEWQNYTAVSQNEGKALQGWSEHCGLSPLVLLFAFLGRWCVHHCVLNAVSCAGHAKPTTGGPHLQRVRPSYCSEARVQILLVQE